MRASERECNIKGELGKETPSGNVLVYVWIYVCVLCFDVVVYCMMLCCRSPRLRRIATLSSSS